MNLYTVQETEGTEVHVQAPHMQGAIEAAQQIFVKDNYDWLQDEEEVTPDEYYQNNVLLGCVLIGELANPTPDRRGPV